MYDARAVSNFFYHRARRAGLPLTVMTLLKVLYFAHGWHLAKFGTPLVAQPFEAWKHGPVNRVVYDQFKKFGKRPIDKEAVSLDPITASFIPTPYKFSTDVESLLEHIFDYYAKFHAFTLSELTHERGGPWDQIWTQAQFRAVPGMHIPNNLILDWFLRGRSDYSTHRERGDIDGSADPTYSASS
jgi:uncharacterized phage-associated protein